MNVKPLVTLLCLFSASFAFAGFKVPSKVYQIAELEKAKAEAIEKGKPLAILYSDAESTCPLCSDASTTMMKELGSKTVMVYIKTRDGLPRLVIDTLTPGKYIPKIAVFDSKLEKPLGMVTYEAVKEDSRSAFRNVEKAIRDYKVVK